MAVSFVKHKNLLRNLGPGPGPLGPDQGPDLGARTWDPTLGPGPWDPDQGPGPGPGPWGPARNLTLGPGPGTRTRAQDLGPGLGPDLGTQDHRPGPGTHTLGALWALGLRAATVEGGMVGLRSKPKAGSLVEP